MDRFPHDFAEWLTPSGRALAEGRHEGAGALKREAFFTATDLVDPAAARELPALFERVFGAVMGEMSRPLPDPTAGPQAHEDHLPKTGRMLSTPHEDGPENAAYAPAVESGLLAMVESPAYQGLMEVLTGRSIARRLTTQLLCYRVGDYVGPHTDHHPELAGGYSELHLTACTPGVKHQLLVYERKRHFSETVDVTRTGTLTACRSGTTRRRWWASPARAAGSCSARSRTPDPE